MPIANYELSGAQINTPVPVLRFYWQLVKQHRPQLGTVLDLGAGDGRFARYGHFKEYEGIEIDPQRIPPRPPRQNASLYEGCAFSWSYNGYDACIGNPPYLRHHDIESPWKERNLASLGKALGIELNGHGNLYLHFIALALLKSKADGLIALLVPFDWTSRPSARPLRDFVRRKRWAVSVYRFRSAIFPDVTTTASISIIDKATALRGWRMYNVRDDFSIVERRGLTGTGKRLLPYHRGRGRVFARRGMSPGTQKVFTLTEGERVHHGIEKRDVIPCVTSLRDFPGNITTLTETAFKKHFVDKGRRCWLIDTRSNPSKRLMVYLDGIPPSKRATATCQNRNPWYVYEHVDASRLLLQSGFSGQRPKVLINEIGAIPVGAMYGLYGAHVSARTILKFIQGVNILDIIVPNSGQLRKIEVGQLNALLANKWPARQ